MKADPSKHLKSCFDLEVIKREKEGRCNVYWYEEVKKDEAQHDKSGKTSPKSESELYNESPHVDDSLNKKNLRNLQISTTVNTSKIQKFSFSNSSNENGQYNEYWSIPTVGDGNCFFHAFFTIENYDTNDVNIFAAEKRERLVERVNSSENVALKFRDIAYEYYNGLQATANAENIPAPLMKLFQENNDYSIARNVSIQLGVDPLPEQCQALE